MENTIRASIDIDKAANLIENGILHSSLTGEMIDYYEVSAQNDIKCIVMIFERHYLRAGNRLTLTVTLDNINGVTRIHYVGGGGGEGFFKFDWGAAESFGELIPKILDEFII